MGTDSSPELGQLSTEWSLIFQAYGGPPELAASAQIDLMARYAGAVHRYLVGAVGDRDAVDELDQEFAVRFLRGDFHRADPTRGRFRDFVKRSLRNLMIDYRRRRSARPCLLGDGLPEPLDMLTGDRDFERRFIESWRAELLARAWEALARFEERTGHPYHTALRLRSEHTELRSDELAERLTAATGRAITTGAMRMILHRSRERFVGFLLDEVRQTRASATPEELEQELSDLGLLEYCRSHIERRGHPS